MDGFGELYAHNPFVWNLFIFYLILTLGLSVIGFLKTTDIKSFSVGSGDLNPVVVGITLAASIASTATFVINPGFVYVHGLSAIMHLGVSAGLGVIIGLFVMSFGFRRQGKKNQCSHTAPMDWTTIQQHRFDCFLCPTQPALLNLCCFDRWSPFHCHASGIGTQ